MDPTTHDHTHTDTCTEVGIARVSSCSDYAQQRVDLRLLLDTYGSSTELWCAPPRLVYDCVHQATVMLGQFGTSYVVPNPRHLWAATGWLVSPPQDQSLVLVPGVRLLPTPL